MKVLVACEFSGIVREAFTKHGHAAWSCDYKDTEISSTHHYRGNVLDILGDNWDLMIAHPPCTHLAVSGRAWFYRKKEEQKQALWFVKQLLSAPIEKIALENPVSVISTRIRKPDQIIQPYEFGHMEQKKTCLWLKNLPPLKPTKNVFLEMMKLPKNQRERLHYLPPGPRRADERSKTFQGIAEAMAEQWTASEPRKEER